MKKIVILSLCLLALGVCIVGDLLCSQLLTIFSTLVIYLYIDKLKHFKLKAL